MKTIFGKEVGKKNEENKRKIKKIRRKLKKTEETPTKSNFDSGKIKCSKSGQY
jgi:hypothetical protein